VSGSVRFDRAAEFYDRTRSISDDAMSRTVDLLASELDARGRILEVGVGTGLLALPLHERGIDVAGLDISAPMLNKLVEKAGGRVLFPLVLGDATRLPFADDSFGASYLRWVLHLVGDWPAAVSEMVRVVRPRGLVAVNHGGFSGVGRDIRRKMEELVGRSLLPVGLDWEGWRDLETQMQTFGATRRELEPVMEHSDEPLSTDVDAIGANQYSWTWGLADAVRLEAVAELRTWLEGRFGDLNAPHPHKTEVVWHAYDLA
jgi:ubiquinone/menaquinone biosynthesis C-methylase UbiE